MWNAWPTGWWVLMPLFVIVFFGAATWFVLTIGRNAPRLPDLGRDAEGEAERILAERYARGEINDDEYRHRLGTLRRAAAPSP